MIRVQAGIYYFWVRKSPTQFIKNESDLDINKI